MGVGLSRNLLVAGLCLLTALASDGQKKPNDNTLAILHVTVIDGTGASPKADQTVLIQGTQIAMIGPTISVRPPKSARMIEARGLYLIPGLWDMHVHIWDADLAFPLFLANGVTGVRNTGGHPGDLMRWREELREGKRLGPRLIACGPVVDGAPPIHPDHSVVVEGATEGRSTVHHLKSQGWEFIKLYDNVPRDAYFAIAAEAKKENIPFVGHVPLSVTATEASDAGQKSIEHFEGVEYVLSPLGEGFRQQRLDAIGKLPQPGEMMKLPMRITNEINQIADTYDEKRAGQVFAKFAHNGTWQTPTLSVKRVYSSNGDSSLYEDLRLKYVSRGERDGWEHNPIVHLEISEYVAARKRAFEQALRTTRAARQDGVRFLAGTDSGGVPYLYYGFSLHDELSLLVEGGFTPMQALQAATRDPAEFLGLHDLGTVEVGKRADLILLSANPLDDIHNTSRIDAVILAGRLLGRHELDQFLTAVENRAKE